MGGAVARAMPWRRLDPLYHGWRSLGYQTNSDDPVVHYPMSPGRDTDVDSDLLGGSLRIFGRDLLPADYSITYILRGVKKEYKQLLDYT